MATRRPTAAVILAAVAAAVSWWAGTGGPAFGQPARKLIWGTDTNSQVYVLDVDTKAAHARPPGQ